jgi:hypothetical protein
LPPLRSVYVKPYEDRGIFTDVQYTTELPLYRVKYNCAVFFPDVIKSKIDLNEFDVKTTKRLHVVPRQFFPRPSASGHVG